MIQIIWKALQVLVVFLFIGMLMNMGFIVVFQLFNWSLGLGDLIITPVRFWFASCLLAMLAGLFMGVYYLKDRKEIDN